MVSLPRAGYEALLTCVNSAADQNAAMSAQFNPSWLAAWRISARHITLSATCRAACHLMARLLNVGLVPYSQVKDIAEGVLSSVDVNGPADAVDATIHYWATVATLRAAENLGSAYDTIERVLRWLLKRWSPSERVHCSIRMALIKRNRVIV